MHDDPCLDCPISQKLAMWNQQRTVFIRQLETQVIELQLLLAQLRYGSLQPRHGTGRIRAAKRGSDALQSK